MATAILNAARLRELLSYNEKTGVFVWREKPCQAIGAGDVAGSITSLGYRRIRIHPSRYMAHRLAWLYVYGEWPSGEIDHINGKTDDNSIGNLRVLSRQGNQHSQHSVPSNSKSGVRGVSKRASGFVARICVNGVSVNLGTHDTAEKARAAYWAAKVSMHETVVDRLHATAADREIDLRYRDAS